jgi:hypothetical protein
VTDSSALLLSLVVFASLFLLAVVVIVGGGAQTRPRRSRVRADWRLEGFQLSRPGAA